MGAGGGAWSLVLLATPRSRQLLWWELQAPGGCLRSPEVPPAEEAPLCTVLERSTEDPPGTRAGHPSNIKIQIGKTCGIYIRQQEQRLIVIFS